MMEKKLKVGDLVIHSLEFGKNDGGDFWGRGLGIIVAFDEDGDPVVYFTGTGTSACCYWQEITGVFGNDK